MVLGSLTALARYDRFDRAKAKASLCYLGHIFFRFVPKADL
jgi:hypothetical protein